MNEMGLEATCEGYRGEVPGRTPDSPPTGSFSYTHRPARSGAHGPAGSWVDFSIPQNSSVCVLLKIVREPRGARGTTDAAWEYPADLPYTSPEQLAYPIPPKQLTLYPPEQVTLYLPDSLPYTSHRLPYTSQATCSMPFYFF